MKRAIERRFLEWKDKSPDKALLVTGARQTGKTYSIREFGRKNFGNFVEINFLENRDARLVFSSAKNVRDIILGITLYAERELVAGDTLVFFDEVQECAEIVTAVKFLVEDGRFRYALSGSLLGVEMKNVRSVPVGFMETLRMYPLDFAEFLDARGISPDVYDEVQDCFARRRPVTEGIHSRLLDLYHTYIITGGMPAVVKKFMETDDLNAVVSEQKSIVGMYRIDISKYDAGNKLYINDIFDRIPSELAAQNKKFKVNKIGYGLKFDRLSNGFLWLTAAGVAISVYCANEPVFPLELSRSRNSMKLFLNDTGLLTSMYANDMHKRLLCKDANVNFGGVYENVVAQELYRNSVRTYFYRNNRVGEIDFVAEMADKVVPIEVKSGKDYKIHSALNHLLKAYDGIETAYILSNGNLSVDGRKVYLPIYMAGCIGRN